MRCGRYRFMHDLAANVKELCPKAHILNYVNPMAAVCWALGTVPGISFIGLCHGVQTTLDLISGYVGVPKEQIDFTVRGHQPHGLVSQPSSTRGRTIYPLFKERCEKPEYYINEKVRIETMRHFGYFMTESTGHLSEYLPWFRKNQKALDLYCDEPAFGGETGAYYKWCRLIADHLENVDMLAEEPTAVDHRKR